MKGNDLRNAFLLLLFNGTAIANIADNAADSPATSLYFGLHTGWPGAAGAQNTNEVAYTGYSRVAKARTSGGFTVTSNSVSPASTVTFGACTANDTTAYFWSVGLASSGAGTLLYAGPIGSKLGVATAATDDTITIPGLSGLSVGDRITFLAAYGESLPTGITEGTVYFVKSVSGDDITISTTQGGSTVDITAVGRAVAWKVTPLVITSAPEVTPSLSTATTITEF